MILSFDATNRAKNTYNTLEDRFNHIHNNEYDYSQSVFLKMTDKISIICPEHGIFEQTPANHVNGQGCRLCSIIKNSKKQTLDSTTFITKANNKHNFKYNYDKLEYITMNTKVKIICKEHGIFEQKPGNHLSGAGCPTCSRNKKHTDESFITTANNKHNFKYNYDKVEYESAFVKVKIICREHGEYFQTPASHLYGNGCPVCSGNVSLDHESYIKKANKIHNHLYTYGDFVKNKIIINCCKHGEFIQSTHNHLLGNGCPACAREKTNYSKYKNQKTTLYYVKINELFWKIGLTKKSVEKRFKKEIESGVNIDLVFTKEYSDGYQAFLIEQEVLNQTIEYKVTKNESPITGGWTEIRNINIEAHIKNLI